MAAGEQSGDLTIEQIKQVLAHLLMTQRVLNANVTALVEILHGNGTLSLADLEAMQLDVLDDIQGALSDLG